MDRIEHFELGTNRTAALALEAGCVIRVRSGRLWLTMQGQPDDVWLQAADWFTLPASGTVWISAEPVAQFQVARCVKALGWPTLRGLKAALFGTARHTAGALWHLRDAAKQLSIK